MTRLQGGWHALALGFTLVCLTIPAAALWVPRFAIFRTLGVLDTYVPLIAPALVGTSPLLVLLCYWSARGIPRDLIDAARLSGLGPLQVWWRVVLPLTKATAFAVAALAFIAHWSNFVEPLLYLFDTAKATLPIGLSSLRQLGATDVPVLLAGRADRHRAAGRGVRGRPARRAVAGARSGVAGAMRTARGWSPSRRRSRSRAAAATTTRAAAPATGSSARSSSRSPATPRRRGSTASWPRATGARPGARSRSSRCPSATSTWPSSPRASRPGSRRTCSCSTTATWAASRRARRSSRRPTGSSPPQAFAREDFYPLPMQAFEWDGELQCVPQNTSSLAVYYNVDAFKAAGVKRPADDWTYDEFAAAAEKLTGDGRHGVGIDVNVIRTAPWVWSAGGELVDDPERPTRFTLDTPEAPPGAREPARAAARGLGAERRRVRREGGRRALPRRQRGDAPVLAARRAAAAHDRRLRVGRRGVPRPTSGRRACCTRTASACAKGGDTDAAWAWIEYALGPEGQEVLAQSGRSVPSLKAVAESPAFLDAADPPASSQVFLDALEHMQPLPVTQNWNEVEKLADDVLVQLYYGELEVDEALARLAQETDGQVLTARLDGAGTRAALRRGRGAARRRSDRRAGRARRGAGRVRLGQVDAAARDRRARAGRRRPRADRRRGPGEGRAAQARRGDGVPVVRAVPAPVGRAQHRVRDAGAARAGRRDRAPACVDTATALRLDELLDRRPAELSGGERQRVALGPRAGRRARGCCCWTSRCRTSTRSCG